MQKNPDAEKQVTMNVAYSQIWVVVKKQKAAIFIFAAFMLRLCVTASMIQSAHFRRFWLAL